MTTKSGSVKTLLAFLLAVPVFFVGSASVSALDIDGFNAVVNQTNFILDDRCSATLISLKHRLVLTNHHCVADKIVVEDREEPQSDGTVKKVRREKRTDATLTQKSYAGHEQVGAASYQAEVVAHKKRADLALLRIRAESIPHTVESRLLPDGRPVRRGSRVYIVGNPKMLDASVVEGVVSSTTRTLEPPWAENERVPFYQISGGLAGGNSGGALYLDDGSFIGIPAAGYSDAPHLGFAIPVTAIKAFLREACYAAAFDPSAPAPEACLAEKKARAEKKAPSLGDER